MNRVVGGFYHLDPEGVKSLWGRLYQAVAAMGVWGGSLRMNQSVITEVRYPVCQLCIDYELDKIGRA